MRCLSPRTVGFHDDGKTLCWSSKRYSKEFPTFPFPCGKCLECRAEQGATKAVRCVHEARMHRDSCFITLTYDDRFLPKRLVDSHVVNFVKRLRDRYSVGGDIGVVRTGEYGDANKRPHWHLLVFGWSPRDAVFKYTSDHGDKVYSSLLLGHRDKSDVDNFCLPKLHPGRDDARFKKMLWKFGIAEFGSLTMKSASYCCRYALKKLVHGKDQDHDFHPRHNFRNRIAIGRRWIELYWRDVFTVGACVIDGVRHPIPRYYVDWLKKNEPEAFIRYVTELKAERSAALALRAEKEQADVDVVNWSRLDVGKGFQISKNKVRSIIVDERIKRLQSHLKGDI